MRRQPAMQPLHLVKRYISARWIVGIGEEYDLGALAHRREHRIHVRGMVLLRRDDRRGARAEDRDRIDQKCVRGVDRLVAVAEIGRGNQMQQIIRAGATNDALGIESERATDRGAQRGCGAIGIIGQVLGGRVIRRDRARAWTKRRLVR
jgi:hypothetical protein